MDHGCLQARIGVGFSRSEAEDGRGELSRQVGQVVFPNSVGIGRFGFGARGSDVSASSDHPFLSARVCSMRSEHLSCEIVDVIFRTKRDLSRFRLLVSSSGSLSVNSNRSFPSVLVRSRCVTVRASGQRVSVLAIRVSVSHFSILAFALHFSVISAVAPILYHFSLPLVGCLSSCVDCILARRQAALELWTGRVQIGRHLCFPL